jgi:hypothetical protein
VLWLREHNRIARKLEGLFGNLWGDERIFQETRRIIGAMLQHITYTEYLPLILGKEIMQRFDLNTRRRDEFLLFLGYDACENPGIRQGFFAAAFRFGHSMIKDRAGMIAASGSFTQPRFRELFLRPDPMYQKEGVEKVVRGLFMERPQSVDR